MAHTIRIPKNTTATYPKPKFSVFVGDYLSIILTDIDSSYSGKVVTFAVKKGSPTDNLSALSNVLPAFTDSGNLTVTLGTITGTTATIFLEAAQTGVFDLKSTYTVEMQFDMGSGVIESWQFQLDTEQDLISSSTTPPATGYTGNAGKLLKFNAAENGYDSIVSASGTQFSSSNKPVDVAWLASTSSVITASQLQGRAVYNTAPSDGNVLAWSAANNRWQPSTAAGGVSDGDKGDITVSSSGATWTIDSNVITLAKMATISSGSFLGRTTASTGNVEELTTAAVQTQLGVDNGWVSAGETWTYAGADSPTFTFTISGDKTAKYYPGMKVKLTQTTVKYFIITKVAYSAPNTTVTIYGGTDYTLANAAISSNYYSMVRVPAGFPMNPAKWTVEVNTNTRYATASPAQNTWYNATNIVVPIGCWRMQTSYVSSGYKTTATQLVVWSTLSTANNSESDADFTSAAQVEGASGTMNFQQLISKEKILDLASKTTYYLNYRTTTASVTEVGINGDTRVPVILRAICAYL